VHEVFALRGRVDGASELSREGYGRWSRSSWQIESYFVLPDQGGQLLSGVSLALFDQAGLSPLSTRHTCVLCAVHRRYTCGKGPMSHVAWRTYSMIVADYSPSASTSLIGYVRSLSLSP
jgi:hypothetical protein